MGREYPHNYGVPCYVDGKYNPEYGKRYRAANPERAKAAYRRYIERNPRRDHRTREYRIMAVNLIFERDKGICGICNQPVSRAESSIDHVVQVALGGGHEVSNLRLSHLSCNYSRPKKNHKSDKQCSIDGCGSRHRCRGLCGRHYQQWKLGKLNNNG